MKSLFVVSCVLATLSSIEITSYDHHYDVDKPLILGKNMKWAGGENFTGYHLNTNRLYRDKRCRGFSCGLSTESYCFEKTSQEYVLGKAEQVSEIVIGEGSGVNVVTGDGSLTRNLKEEGPDPINLHEALAYISPNVPRGFTYAHQATARANVAFTFRGSGFAFISFRPIYLQVHGVHSYKFNGSFFNSIKVKTTSYLIPVTLPDGTLDGIYELKGNYNLATVDK
ncbi:hypothetical protein DSO57_1032365 [Entomophthora muscae]|uniref:Uncharacterized protein n=1 Tax=Entomophthora muscae TaxID=34485 RepID=A0ACC2UL08_9FUNG|nr:hypothetical protein DSO57_1032365 [Entomophthora muscae]